MEEELTLWDKLYLRMETFDQDDIKYIASTNLKEQI